MPNRSFKLHVDDFLLMPLPSGRQKVVLLFSCPSCGKKKEIDEFGLRCVNGETHIRQSWCRSCRSESSAKSV